MLIRRILLALAAVSISASCSNAPSAARDMLLGRWVTDRETVQPEGSQRHYLTFAADGRFIAEVRMYGLYPGQRADDLSSYSRTTGTFVVAGDRLTFAPEALAVWDRFYGADSPETVQAPYPYTGFYDDTRFRLGRDALRLDYTTYPADAAVPTTQLFRRDR